MSELSPAGTKAEACAYILHMLLQRLEAQQPGLVQNMLLGAKADLASFNGQENMPEPVSKVFNKAISILELIHSQNQIVG
jgi:hypothetical protein